MFEVICFPEWARTIGLPIWDDARVMSYPLNQKKVEWGTRPLTTLGAPSATSTPKPVTVEEDEVASVPGDLKDFLLN